MKTMDSLITERDDAENRADYAESRLAECQVERDVLAAELRIVRSMPVTFVIERLRVELEQTRQALRALVDRCPDCGGSGIIHREGWFSNEISEGHECSTCSECDRCGPARRVLNRDSAGA